MFNVKSLTVIAIAACGSSSAFGGYMYASSVEHFDQGLRKNGSAVAGDRSDPTQALGAPQLTDTINFVSLGIGGELILGFDGLFAKDSVIVWETTYGNPSNYPESAEVWIGFGETWDSADFVMVADLQNDMDGIEIPLASIETEMTSFNFVKFIDTTDINLHNGSADGFDIDGVGVVPIPAPGSAVLATIGAGMCVRRRRLG